MKNLSSLLGRAGLMLAGALALGACSRGQYAMLPKAPAYLNSAPVAAKAPHPAAPVAVAAPVISEAVMPAPKLAATAPVPQPVATAPVRQPVAPAQVAAPVADAPAASPTPAVATAVPAPARLNLVQRLALKKITKKLDKLASQAPQFKQRDAAAGTQRLDSKLKQIIVIGAIGIGLEILGGALSSGLIYVVGVIFILVALVLLLLYFLDKA